MAISSKNKKVATASWKDVFKIPQTDTNLHGHTQVKDFKKVELISMQHGMITHSYFHRPHQRSKAQTKSQLTQNQRSERGELSLMMNMILTMVTMTLTATITMRAMSALCILVSSIFPSALQNHLMVKTRVEHRRRPY